MKGEKMEDKKSSSTLATITTVFMVSTAALAYVSFELFFNQYQVSKSNFICTKIEQVGKNLDDVRCVQYTSSKYSKEAISLNSASSFYDSLAKK